MDRFSLFVKKFLAIFVFSAKARRINAIALTMVMLTAQLSISSPVYAEESTSITESSDVGGDSNTSSDADSGDSNTSDGTTSRDSNTSDGTTSGDSNTSDDGVLPDGGVLADNGVLPDEEVTTFKVTYDGDGNTSGVVPVDETEYKLGMMKLQF